MRRSCSCLYHSRVAALSGEKITCNINKRHWSDAPRRVDNLWTMPATLESATQHHHAGRLEQAEAGYRDVLARDPRNADALHLLGVVAHQSGRCGEAIALISQAIALNDSAPAYHHNLGEAHRAAGDADAALPCFARAI